MSERVTDDEIAWRRFGPKHEKPCRRPSVITCALWQCQYANECQNIPTANTAGVVPAISDKGAVG